MTLHLNKTNAILCCVALILLSGHSQGWAQLRQISNEELKAAIERQRQIDFEKRNAPYVEAVSLIAGKVGLPDDLPTNIHASTVWGYDEESVKQLTDMINDDSAKWDRFRGNALHMLGIIGSVDPDTVPLESVSSIVSSIEQDQEISESRKIQLLNSGYRAIAYYGNEDALAYLIARVDGSAWHDMPIPESRMYVTHSEGVSYLNTGQSLALLNIATMAYDPAVQYIEEMETIVPPEEDDELYRSILVGKSLRGTHSNLRNDRKITYQSRLARQALETTVPDDKETRPTPAPELPLVDGSEKSSDLKSPPDAAPSGYSAPDTPAPQPPERNTPFLWLGLGIIVLLLGAFVFLKHKPK